MSTKVIVRLFCLLVLVGLVVLGPASSAKAERIMIRSDYYYPVDYSTFVQCINNGAGDYVHITGIVNFHVRQVTDATDYRALKTVININFVHASAVGLTTGMQYQFSENLHSQYTTASFPMTRRDHGSYRAVGPGKNNIMLIRYVYEYTINENYDWVVNRSEVSVNCETNPYP